MVSSQQKRLLLSLLILCTTGRAFGAGESCEGSHLEINGMNKVAVSDSSKDAATKDLSKDKKVSKIEDILPPKDLKTAWTDAQKGIEVIRTAIEGGEDMIRSLLTAFLSKEFVWVNGDPGGAKTFVARILMDAELRTIPDQTKQVFLLQFHKLLNEGVITGFPDLNKMLDNGEYLRKYDNSLIADKYIFLIADEVEKASPALQATLLSVLAERKAFLGSEVVDTLLTSGVFTSNKTIGELIASAGDDKAAIEALLDRMAIKNHQPNQNIDAAADARMLEKIEAAKKSEKIKPHLGILYLKPLLQKVEVPRELFEEFAHIQKTMDTFYNHKLVEAEEFRKQNKIKNFFPPNQFSNRSLVKLFEVWKAAFLVRQLAEGVPFEQMRTKMTSQDLRDMAPGALLNTIGIIRNKTIPVSFRLMDPFNPSTAFHTVKDAAYDPSTGTIYYQDLSGASKIIRIDETGKKVLYSSEPINEALLFRYLSMAHPAGKRPNMNEIEDDGMLAKLLAKRTLPKRTREELEFIAESRRIFINSVNASIAKLQGHALDYNLRDERAVLARAEMDRKSNELNQRLTSLYKNGASTAEIYNGYFDLVRQASAELRNDFKEMDHSVLAHMVSILAGNHLFVYGPPGGAKTALARVVLGQTLRSVNQSTMVNFENHIIEKYKKVLAQLKAKGDKHSNEYELFLRQFHKMVPEGEILGFPKLNEQMKGNMAYDRSQSMSHERFMFAILDEVEKGNAALMTTLLSILNEREVFAGHEVVKTTLITAIMTSNKVPSEFLASFGDDLAAGLALMDRAVNKVFVPNKFAKEKSLTDMLMEIQTGTFKPHLTAHLPLVEIQSLMAKVKIQPRIRDFLLQVREEYFAQQMEKEEQSKEAHEADSLEFPNTYIVASQPSNRTQGVLLEQFKASYLLNEILSGKKIEEMTFEPTWQDVGLFAQGLTFWGPGKIEAQFNQEGVLNFQYVDHGIEALINSPTTTARVRYQLERVKDEGETFANLATSMIGAMMQEHRKLIAQHPELFPTLFSNPEKREHWLKQQGLKP